MNTARGSKSKATGISVLLGLIFVVTTACGGQSTTGPGPGPSGPDEPDPNPPAPEVDPFLVEDFSSYGSTSELRNDSRGIYSETDGASHLHLDTSVGLNQGGFDLSQSMRYDFSASGYPQRVIGIDGTNDLWVEVWFRFSTNWRTDLGVGSANPDYKWIFGGTTPSRFEFKTGLFGNNYSASAPQESNVAEPSGSSDEWDGEWHRLRLHFGHESSDGAGDGTIEVWIDDEKIIDEVGTVVTNRSLGPIVRAALGRNHNHLNHGGDPGETMSLWWGRVALWNANPGW